MIVKTSPAGEMSETLLDLKGLKCPLPALKARKALKAIAPGARLRVICTDPMAAIDIPNLVRETGDLLLEKGQTEAVLSFVIEKAA
jgi:tRNA 2-thiouridine synthesizing protein A